MSSRTVGNKIVSSASFFGSLKVAPSMSLGIKYVDFKLKRWYMVGFSSQRR